MDKLELVPLLMNIYKGFVILPKSSQLSPRNKEENTNQKKYKEKDRRKKSAPYRNGAAYHKKHVPGKLFCEDSISKKNKNKINRRKKKTKPNKYAKKEEIISRSWTHVTIYKTNFC